MEVTAAVSALERVYREHGERLWRALLAFGGDQDVASEAVAEAFTQALARGDALHDTERWIWKAAFRIAAGLLKERRRNEPLAEHGSCEMEEPARELIEALRKLSPAKRAPRAFST